MNTYEWSKIPSILKTGEFLQNMNEEEVVRFIPCPCSLESFTENITSVSTLICFIQTLQAFCVDNISKQLCQNKTCLTVLFNLSKEQISSLMAHDQIAQCTEIVELLKLFLDENKEVSFAIVGNLDCLSYILDKITSLENKGMCRVVAKNDQCRVLARNGHLNCLTYIPT